MRPPLVSPLPHGGHGPSLQLACLRAPGQDWGAPWSPRGPGASQCAAWPPGLAGSAGAASAPNLRDPHGRRTPRAVTHHLLLALSTTVHRPEPHLSRASRGLNEAFRPGPAALAAAGRWWHLVGHDALAVLRHAASRERPFPPAHRSPSASPLPPAPGSRPLPRPWSEPRRTRRFADHGHVDPPAIARTPCSPHSGQPQPAHSAVVQVALRHAHGGEPFAPLF